MKTFYVDPQSFGAWLEEYSEESAAGFWDTLSSHLSPDSYDLLFSHFKVGMTHEEYARRRGLAAPAVRQRYCRLLAWLATCRWIYLRLVDEITGFRARVDLE